jgi:hypothetical protein
MKTVRIYDMKTRQSREISANELAPGFVKVRFAETREEAFVRAADVKTQPGYQHPPFAGELKQLMADFAAVFQDVLPMTPAQWEDGFRRDLDYEKEIEFWANVAGAYRHFTTCKELSRAARRDVFNIVFSCLSNGLAVGLECGELKALSRAEAVEIRKRLKAGSGEEGTPKE